MLIRKTFRDFRKNFGTFFSVFLLSGLAIALFCTFEGSGFMERDLPKNNSRRYGIWILWKTHSFVLH